jgi:hypothetical protein
MFRSIFTEIIFTTCIIITLSTFYDHCSLGFHCIIDSNFALGIDASIYPLNVHVNITSS